MDSMFKEFAWQLSIKFVSSWGYKRLQKSKDALNKANSSDTEAPFLDLNLSITNGIVSSKIYDNGMILILK